MSIRRYKRQVALLLKVLPIISKETDFALHGGTAINLFQRNMPRLSVDIDLTYLPVADRKTSLMGINQKLLTIQQNILRSFPGINVEHKSEVSKLILSNGKSVVKVEVNQIKRGCYAKSRWMSLCARAQEEFNSFCEVQVVEKGHLYGGKICAALDRQHPRDLFDIRYMLDTEELSAAIIKGFIFYLISSNRPISEMLAPQFLDQRIAHENQFAGMTEELFPYGAFEKTRSELIDSIHQSLTIDDQQFLVSIEAGSPNWSIYDFKSFPAVQWKLMNVQKLRKENPKKYRGYIDSLTNVFHKLK